VNRVQYVAVLTTGDVVVLGRTWDAATGSPSPTENLASQGGHGTAHHDRARTTVTFENPAGNTRKHCAGFPRDTGEIIVS
jgi:hypothetical protein